MARTVEQGRPLGVRRRPGSALRLDVGSAVGGVIAVYLTIVPIAMILVGSLQTGSPLESTGWSLSNFRDVFLNASYLRSLGNTAIISAGSVIVSVTLGSVLAWSTARIQLPAVRLIQLGIVVPFLMSPLIGSVAWSYLGAPSFGLLNRLATLSGLSLLHINIYSRAGIAWVSGIYSVPITYLLVGNGLQSMNYALEEAAEVSGAPRWRTLRTVVAPVLIPAILSSALLEFVDAAEDYAAPQVLGSPARIDVLATRIAIDLQSTPQNYGRATAGAVILMAVAVLGLVGYQFMTRRQRRFEGTSGKATLPPRKATGPTSRIGGGAIVGAYIAAASVLPLVVLILVSLQGFYGEPLWPLRLTLNNYGLTFSSVSFVPAVVNSVVVAVLGAAACVALGALVAYRATRQSPSLFARGADLAATIPVAIPGIVLGLALIWTYIRLPLPIYGTLVILVIVAMTARLPYATRFVSSALVQLGPELEEASTSTGAGWVRRVRTITAPLLTPALASSFIVSFIITIRELSTVVLLYTYNTVVLPVQLLENLTEGLYTQAAALTMVMIGIMVVAWVVVSRFLRNPLDAIS